MWCEQTVFWVWKNAKLSINTNKTIINNLLQQRSNNISCLCIHGNNLTEQFKQLDTLISTLCHGSLTLHVYYKAFVKTNIGLLYGIKAVRIYSTITCVVFEQFRILVWPKKLWMNAQASSWTNLVCHWQDLAHKVYSMTTLHTATVHG